MTSASTASTAPRPRLLSGGEALALCGASLRWGPVLTAPCPPLEDFARACAGEGGTLCAEDPEAAGLAFGAAAGGAVPLLGVAGAGLGRIADVLSAACAAELPMVVAVSTRGGPGNGNDFPSQTDYLLATRSPGTGGVAVPVLAPASPQEAVDLLPEALGMAAAERTPVLLLLDALVARTREGVRLPDPADHPPPRLPSVREGSLLGAAPQGKEATEVLDRRLWEKARGWEPRARAVATLCEDAEYVLVAYGSCARVAETTLEKARKRDVRLGLFRPVSLRPFPADALREALGGVRGVLVVELSQGQMLQDVREVAPGGTPVEFYGRTGGAVPTPFELMHQLFHLVEVTQ